MKFPINTLLLFLIIFSIQETHAQQNKSSKNVPDFMLRGSYDSWVNLPVADQVVERAIFTDTSINLFDPSNNLFKKIPFENRQHHLTDVRFSPDQSKFIAYEETENGVNNLYFYNIKGLLLRIAKVNNIIPIIQYSITGSHVVIHNHFGNEVYVFDQLGNRIFYNPNFCDLIKNTTAPLESCGLSQDGKELLFFSNKLYCYSLKTNSITWSVDVKKIYSLNYIDPTHILIAKKSAGTKFTLNIINKRGSLVKELPEIDTYYLQGKKIVIEKNKKILVYEIKY